MFSAEMVILFLRWGYTGYNMEYYIPLLMTVGAAVIFAVITMVATEVLGPKRSTAEKLTTYESGMPPFTTAQGRVSVKYYMVAVLFILFDIEVVFLYPWAVQFRTLGWMGLWAMLTFMVVLLGGYIYVWKKGAFEWR
jgi:NADH-quinone oxidoreductase subunit A